MDGRFFVRRVFTIIFPEIDRDPRHWVFLNV
jgi:hypothetical protein